MEDLKLQGELHSPVTGPSVEPREQGAYLGLRVRTGAGGLKRGQKSWAKWEAKSLFCPLAL